MAYKKNGYIQIIIQEDQATLRSLADSIMSGTTGVITIPAGGDAGYILRADLVKDRDSSEFSIIVPYRIYLPNQQEEQKLDAILQKIKSIIPITAERADIKILTVVEYVGAEAESASNPELTKGRTDPNANHESNLWG